MISVKSRALFSQIKIRSIPKIKMREKTKLEIIEEIPLEEIESKLSQVKVEGQLSIDFRHLI